MTLITQATRLSMFRHIASLSISLAVSTSAVATTWGNALQFDGTNDYAKIATTTALPVGNSAYTQEFWLRVDSLPNWAGGYNGFALSRSGEGTLLGNHMVVVNGNAGLTHWGLDRDTNVGLPLGEWHHLAATWDGSTESLYLDGVLRWTASASPLAVTGGSMTFGAHDNGYGYYLSGALDEVRIWNVARTAEQILATYNQTVAVTSSNLVGYWNFDEADGQTLFDGTERAQHLTLGASTETSSDDPVRISRDNISSVPEPSSLALLGLALAAFGFGARCHSRYA